MMNIENNAAASIPAGWKLIDVDGLRDELWKLSESTETFGDTCSRAVSIGIEGCVEILEEYIAAAPAAPTAAAAPESQPADRNEALELNYPMPDSPHTSVINRALEARAAFRTGWEAHAAAKGDVLREKVRDAVADSLTSLYVCGRVWSAWGVGTMGEDDFTPADQDDDVLDNITDAVLAALAPAVAPVPAASEGWTVAAGEMPKGNVLASMLYPNGKRRTIVAFHAERFTVECGCDDGIAFELNDADDEFYLREGWYECIQNWDDFSSVTVTAGTVTHYRPLPAAPATSDKAEG